MANSEAMKSKVFEATEKLRASDATSFIVIAVAPGGTLDCQVQDMGYADLLISREYLSVLIHRKAGEMTAK